MTMEIL